MSITGTPAAVAQSVAKPTLWSRWSPSLRFLLSTEVHVYAFAIAANVLLSFIPFCVLLLVLCQKVLHSPSAVGGVLAMLRDSLPFADPTDRVFVTRNLGLMLNSRKANLISVILLLFTANGALLPLEVALNRIW